ncbi:MAG TPA: YdeI/OmpD-associated family protein [Candidatus Angelobacter sp.]|nr:YdeI/OmpD-associated family protein [Candidatus Angelobacter sp.]
MPTVKLVAKTFDAVLERDVNNLGWTIIRIPFDAAKLWGRRGQIRVSGEVNGFPFRTSLFPDGKGGHSLLVNKTMQKGANVRSGMKARFHLEPDSAPRPVSPPQELLALLKQSQRLRKFYESFNPSTRRDIARTLAAVKSSDARKRRVEQFAERLMETMEAEKQLPPLIERSLAQNPLAREGWKLMPPRQRRWHLLGIFGYRSPESRARRLEKAVQEMVTYAEKRAAKQRR